ncbi:ankyrin repeat and SAM domain-containing protein 1A-like [Anguilla rostrata]|uniref:ankyrin repeat and SAM domain-containing protein 1A-like n=1 Tax=Anguilla rostrata TaxID=7938 RepID=UPI0030D60DE0
MGKEQELLEAARTGNLAAVEKLLSARRQSAGTGSGTRSSLLSLWRGPSVNCADSTGYTPLHHAALNGQSEVVQALLRNEALTNIADHKGCSPLHLAAWRGDERIVRLLIHQSPSQPKLNEQNNDNDTPLHCAAQYGHAEVVRLLLAEQADPATRNNRLETPLDLAALYGRLEVVRLLLAAGPALLACRAPTHTPLHLAARNGHLPVVQVLLEAGMDINCETEKGSALHEAALFGKTDVVQKLLSAGIDANMVDSRGHTALDTVREVPSRKSREIAALIRELNEQFSGPEEENPYEALLEDTSCHSLDSLASGKSSDRESGRPDSEGGKKERHPDPAPPSPDIPEEVGSETLHANGSMDEKEVTGEEDAGDPTYELLSTPKTRGPLSRQDSVSQTDEDDVTIPPSSLLPQNRNPSPQTNPGQTLPLLGQDLDAERPGLRAHPGDTAQPARARSAATTATAAVAAVAVPEQFAGLLHGSSPVTEGREDPFQTPSGAPTRPAPGDPRTGPSAMSAPLLDRDPTAIYATVVHSRARDVRDARDPPDATPPGKARPAPGDLKLTRSLSKSDSDLLVSPPGEEEGGLGGRSESVSDCSAGKKHMERSPSFTSEWDEIEKIMNLIGAGIQFSRDPPVTPTVPGVPEELGVLCVPRLALGVSWLLFEAQRRRRTKEENGGFARG